MRFAEGTDFLPTVYLVERSGPNRWVYNPHPSRPNLDIKIFVLKT